MRLCPCDAAACNMTLVSNSLEKEDTVLVLDHQQKDAAASLRR